ncbi:MAG: two-component sensor histidine kinase [Gammaproteobacteria bacterium]|nr:two-component sensor histidine kinase [Gammaproteobacteria bacterium]
MTYSLQRQLSVWLGWTILAFGVLASGISFWFAYDEAQEYQDNMLHQVAMALGPRYEPPSDGPALNTDDEDPEDRIVIQSLDSNRAAVGLSLPANLLAGFHSLKIEDNRWRVYILALPSGQRIAVSQAMDARSDSAIASAFSSLLPVLGLIPLLLLLSQRVIAASLSPVRRLAQIVDARRENQFIALPLDGLPEEILPFGQSINRLLERIAISIGEQRRFIADAAHALRSPLTALTLQVQNLEFSESLTTYRDRLAPLKTGLERSRQLLDQLLTHAHQRANTDEPRQVDLVEVAKTVIEDLIHVAEDRRIELGVEQKGPVQITVQRAAIYLLLLNIVDNALCHTQEDGEVIIRIHVDGDAAVIEVIDNGPGIPEEERERVFDPFYRIPGTLATGSGLGLAIVRDIAIRLGGSVGLTSRDNGRGLVVAYRHPLTG